jgi:DNA-binding NtrC family response regulator
LQRALEAAGFEVVAVPSAEEALDVLDGSTVDLLLTDYRLPGIDGFQLITRTKAIHPALAIIAMSAYGTSESAVEARRRGANDYLVKPFEVPDLLRAVHQAVDQQKSPARGRDEYRTSR